MDSTPLWLMTGDPNLRNRWRRWLSAEGWTVIDLPTPEKLAKMPRSGAGSALLDASLLKESDMEAVRGLSEAKIPVILFGEGPEASNERVARWLQEGADDFIPASIHEKLLIAKLEAHARRARPGAERNVLFSKRRRVKIDSKHGLAWTRQEDAWAPTESLTRTEHDLLRLFLSLPETALERDFIMERIWGRRAHDVYSATLTQHVMSLRKKLGKEGESIRTVYGRGYVFLEEP